MTMICLPTRRACTRLAPKKTQASTKKKKCRNEKLSRLPLSQRAKRDVVTTQCSGVRRDGASHCEVQRKGEKESRSSVSTRRLFSTFRPNTRNARQDVRSRAAAVETVETDEGKANVVVNVLAGLTTTLSMIPESLAFTFVAGVPPVVGLHAAATMAFFTAIFGSQHGVISGAAGATAVVLAPLCAKYGIEYLFGAVVLSGIIQLAFGALRFGKFIRLVPQPVMMGFVNGLAIVIGTSQLEQFRVVTSAGHHVWMSGMPLYVMCALTALTMLIIKLWPKKMKLVSKFPAPLAAILSVTCAVNLFGIQTRTVGDMASIAGSLPMLHIPNLPIAFSTLSIIFPTALSVAAVGLIETLLTQQLVDQITESRSETHVECLAQGVGNVATGLLGGMGGCAMIGQSMINVNSGGRSRISGLSCSFFLAMSVIAGSSLIEKIPLAALVGTMWMLVIDIFDKSTFKRVFKVPKSDSIVVALVTGITVVTNLAIAVLCGVIVSSLNFAWKSAKRISAFREVEDEVLYNRPAAIWKLQGPLFFGSVTQFREMFNPKREKEEVVVLDFLESRVWDSSALEVISEVVDAYQVANKEIHLRHLSPDCAKLLSRAGDLYDMNVIEVDELEDPRYGVSVDYDLIATDDDDFKPKSKERGEEGDQERMERAILRQYSGGRQGNKD